MENRELLIHRFTELAERSSARGMWVFSEFLTLAEQDILLSLRLPSLVTLWGGMEASERKLACFGSEDLCGYTEDPPIVCVKIAPVQQKFADALSHRDFLGSLMALGIRREVLGDIVVSENCGYLFCLATIAGYITDSLTEVRHTTVRCALSEPPAALTEPPEPSEVVVASERLDAVLAAVYRLSRSEAQELIAAEKVFFSGRLIVSASANIPENAIVSVRGKGRFLYEGLLRETKKGRLRVRVRVFS